MMEAMWKKDEGKGPQAAPTWALYSEAVNKFRTSAESFMTHVHLLNEARSLIKMPFRLAPSYVIGSTLATRL